jgi:hypothetical protein
MPKDDGPASILLLFQNHMHLSPIQIVWKNLAQPTLGLHHLLFQNVKCLVSLLRPMKSMVLQQLSQGLADDAIVLNKPSVIACKPKKTT